MSQKVFKVAVDLEIHAITCPGVWLCQNGKLTLRMHILGSCAETTEQKPCFPVLYHEKFIFHRNFQCHCNLSNLHRALSQEKIYIEFIQWTSQDVGNLLATFESSLADVLYPTSNFNRSVLSGVDIDLLMEPMSCFPGIIAPKIEVSTKTTIEEVISKCKCTSCKCGTYVLNPKTLSSQKSPKRSVPARQKQVCHSSQYHNSKNEHFGSSLNHSSPIVKSCKKYERNSLNQPSLNNSYDFENTAKSNNTYEKPTFHSRHSNSNHYERHCSICSKYKTYFSDSDFHCLDLDINKLNSSASDRIKNSHSTVTPHAYTHMKTREQNEKGFEDLDFKKQYPYVEQTRRLHSNSNNVSNRLPSQSDEEWTDSKDRTADTSYNDQFYTYLEKFYKSLYTRAKTKALHEKNKINV